MRSIMKPASTYRGPTSIRISCGRTTPTTAVRSRATPAWMGPPGGINDISETVAVAPAVAHLQELAVNPSRTVADHGEPGRSAVRLPLVERLVEHVLREALHPRREEGDRERLLPPHVRQGPAALRERERDERRLERRLHEPRPEHQVVRAVLRLRPDDVRAVRDLLQHLLLRLLVHRFPAPPSRPRLKNLRPPPGPFRAASPCARCRGALLDRERCCPR